MMDVADTKPSHSTKPTQELSSVVVPLLKGVLYREDNPELWGSLLSLQASVRDYVAVLGLDLMLDEAEGYAFLRSRQDEDEDAQAVMPRLVVRRQLSYPVSLLLALLRKKLAEFDAGGGDTRLIPLMWNWNYAVLSAWAMSLGSGASVSQLMAALRESRSRDVPCGTVGGRTALTQ